MDVRFGVRRAPFFGEPFEHRLGIAVAQLRAGVAARGTLRENRHRRVEPDSDRTLIEQLAGRRINISTAAGGDDTDIALDQPGDEPALAIAEVSLAEAVEHLGGGEAGRDCDLAVALN